MKIIFVFSVVLMLLLSMYGVSAEENNSSGQQSVNATVTPKISITQLDERIIAGNNVTIFLNINSSTEGNLNISFQRDDYKLTFFNISKISTITNQYEINITIPAYLDAGQYELSAELNGEIGTKHIFIDNSIRNIFKDILKSMKSFWSLVYGIIVLVMLIKLYPYIGIHRLIFLSTLVGGTLLIVLSIIFDIDIIPLLKVPTYVLIYSFIGAIGYVCISWFKAEILGEKEDTNGGTGGTEETKKSTIKRQDKYRKWTSRLTAAPIFGMIIYFSGHLLLNDFVFNETSISGLCLLSGLFIKPILYKSREYIFKLLAPNELIKDDINDYRRDFGETDLVELLGQKPSLDIWNNFGYSELREFAILSEDIIKKIAKGIGIEDKDLIEKWKISKLWKEMEEYGCKVDIKEVGKLFFHNDIKKLSDLNSKKDKLSEFGISEENVKCLEKYLEQNPVPPAEGSKK